MDERIYREYVAILKEELQPAMGCTEPIAVAYCAALARKTLGALPETVEVLASANIIKNVKSVIVPNTNGQRGIAAAAAAGVEYHRLLRPASNLPAGSVVLPGAVQAAAYLANRPGRILLATGAKELPAFAALDPQRLYPRVLPNHESLSACEGAGIPHRNILAMQGPFSTELNEALIRQFHIAYLVTKDGGKAGGFEEKLRAAKNTGIELVLIRRPEETGESFEEIAAACEELMKCL